jgi:hypothetical protein
MAPVGLTDRRIAALPTPTLEQRQYDCWDPTMRGFGVRVSYGGKKVFVVRYRVNRRLRRLTIGPYPALSLAEARRKARMVMGDVAQGDDPTQDKQAQREPRRFAVLPRRISRSPRNGTGVGKKRSGSSTRICCRRSASGCWRTFVAATSASWSKRSRESGAHR